MFWSLIEFIWSVIKSITGGVLALPLDLALVMHELQATCDPVIPAVASRVEFPRAAALPSSRRPIRLDPSRFSRGIVSLGRLLIIRAGMFFLSEP
jgi:hypothetical protein